TATDVMVVSGQVVFDAFGRTTAKRYPTTEPKGANTNFSPSIDPVAPTTMIYDVLDRVTRTTLPDASVTTASYGVGADRLGQTQCQVTGADANNKVKQTFRDVRENITTMTEFTQGTAILTSYAYDAMRQIVRLEDDHHNVTTVAYDNLGRRTVTDNPD